MARQATNRKAKATPAVRRGSNASLIAEERHIGRETVDWSNQTVEQVAETLRHYGYFYDHKEGNKWASEWVKKNYTKAQYANFRAAELWRTSMTVCSLCKMMLNGATFDEKRIAWIDKHIQESILAGKSKKVEAKVVDSSNFVKRNPAEIVKEKTSDFIACIEEVVDTWFTGVYVDIENYSVYNELQKVDAAYITAKAVVDYYLPLQKELQELMGPKPKVSDDNYDQLIEAYSHLIKKKQREYLKLISIIISDAEKYMASKKAVRKTRTKRPVSIAQKVSKVKYLQSSSEFQVTSVAPENIIGASVVYLMHTKTRTLTRLESSTTTGMAVKGTTIINFDEDKCEKKKLRKPEVFIAATAKTTKAKMHKEWLSLTTKPSVSNGRINAETIILKVF